MLMALSQSFLMTKLCYVYLPRPQFTSLQKRVFPVYFALQTTLTAVTAVTYPPNSLLTLAENRVDAALLGAKLAISTFNLFVFGPKTSQLMMKRSHQGINNTRHLGLQIQIRLYGRLIALRNSREAQPLRYRCR